MSVAVRFAWGFLQVDDFGPTNETDEPRFYKDVYHPIGATGHRVTAELVFHFLLHVMKDLLRHPLTVEDEALRLEPLPRPMLKDNHAQLLQMCYFSAERFRDLIVESQGWSFVNEGTELRPKWGWVSNTTGSKLVFQLSTMSGMPLREGQKRQVMVANLAVSQSARYGYWI